MSGEEGRERQLQDGGRTSEMDEDDAERKADERRVSETRSKEMDR